MSEAKKFNGSRAYTWVETYQLDRDNKNNYLQENIVALDYDLDKFMELLSKEKGYGPNIDFFTMEELKALV